MEISFCRFGNCLALCALVLVTACRGADSERTNTGPILTTDPGGGCFQPATTPQVLPLPTVSALRAAMVSGQGTAYRMNVLEAAVPGDSATGTPSIQIRINGKNFHCADQVLVTGTVGGQRVNAVLWPKFLSNPAWDSEGYMLVDVPLSDPFNNGNLLLTELGVLTVKVGRTGGSAAAFSPGLSVLPNGGTYHGSTCETPTGCIGMSWTGNIGPTYTVQFASSVVGPYDDIATVTSGTPIGNNMATYYYLAPNVGSMGYFRIKTSIVSGHVTLQLQRAMVPQRPGALSSKGSTTCALIDSPVGSAFGEGIGTGTSPPDIYNLQTGVQCWGSNSRGQLGNGPSCAGPTNCEDQTYPYAKVPVRVAGLEGNNGSARAISVAVNHVCAVVFESSTDTNVRCWGSNTSSELGTATMPAGSDSRVPITVPGTTGASAIAAGTTAEGNGHTCAVISGAVYCWGDNSYGESNPRSSANTITAPTLVLGLSSGVTSVAAGADHNCALLSSGSVKCWGANNSFQLADDESSLFDSSTQLSGIGEKVSPYLYRSQKLAAAGTHSCVLESGGELYCWGGNEKLQVGGRGGAVGFPSAQTLANITGAMVSDGNTCAITGAGDNASCWGANDSFQLGIAGGSSATPTPIPTTYADGFSTTGYLSDLAFGRDHACMVQDGHVNCWAGNSAGQLGSSGLLVPSADSCPGGTCAIQAVWGLQGAVSDRIDQITIAQVDGAAPPVAVTQSGTAMTYAVPPWNAGTRAVTVTLSRSSSAGYPNAKVSFRAVDGSAIAGPSGQGDYDITDPSVNPSRNPLITTGTINFPSGQWTVSFDINYHPTGTNNRTFKLELFDPSDNLTIQTTPYGIQQSTIILTKERTISATNATIAYGSGSTYNFVVTGAGDLANDGVREASVNYTITNGTALRNTNFNVASMTGSTTMTAPGTFVIPITNLYYDPTSAKQFTISLGASNASVVGGPTFTVTIGAATQFLFSASQYEVPWVHGTVQNLTLRPVSAPGAPTSGTVSITANTCTTAPTLGASTINFAAGQTQSVPVTVNVTHGASDCSFNVHFAPAGGTAPLDTLVKVQGRDLIQLQDYLSSRSSTLISLPIKRFIKSTGDVVVGYQTYAQSAQAGKDYVQAGPSTTTLRDHGATDLQYVGSYSDGSNGGANGIRSRQFRAGHLETVLPWTIPLSVPSDLTQARTFYVKLWIDPSTGGPGKFDGTHPCDAALYPGINDGSGHAMCDAGDATNPLIAVATVTINPISTVQFDNLFYDPDYRQPISGTPYVQWCIGRTGDTSGALYVPVSVYANKTNGMGNTVSYQSQNTTCSWRPGDTSRRLVSFSVDSFNNYFYLAAGLGLGVATPGAAISPMATYGAGFAYSPQGPTANEEHFEAEVMWSNQDFPNSIDFQQLNSMLEPATNPSRITGLNCVQAAWVCP